MTDPTNVRLSDHFLLSDFMGCHTSYAKGIANVFEDRTGTKAQEGMCLCETVLEPVVKESPISISFGYVSQDLALNMHSYQDPRKPSYHQWNDGAACDIIVHDMDRQHVPPIMIARALDEEFPMSRTITYSESSFICVATRAAEVNTDRPRKAFYENRYMGEHKAKPKFTTIPPDRENFWRMHKLEHDWRGQGYPSYHGGGIRQAHHIRTSLYTMLSDFLYSNEAVSKGYKNCPTLTAAWIKKFSRVGKVYDQLLDRGQAHRLSIVRAFESPTWNKTERYTWDDNFEIDFIPPVDVNPNDIAQLATTLKGIVAVSVANGERRVSIRGTFE